MVQMARDAQHQECPDGRLAEWAPASIRGWVAIHHDPVSSQGPCVQATKRPAMVFLGPIHLAKADTLPNPMVVATQVGDTTKRA